VLANPECGQSENARKHVAGNYQTHKSFLEVGETRSGTAVGPGRTSLATSSASFRSTTQIESCDALIETHEHTGDFKEW
jgi:hypothetical protein